MHQWQRGADLFDAAVAAELARIWIDRAKSLPLRFAQGRHDVS